MAMAVALEILLVVSVRPASGLQDGGWSLAAWLGALGAGLSSALAVRVGASRLLCSILLSGAAFVALVVLDAGVLAPYEALALVALWIGMLLVHAGVGAEPAVAEDAS